MIKSDDKTLWREKWLCCLNELTSLDIQKKSWLDKTQTNQHWSFIEFICSYFDDVEIADNYKLPLEKGWLTNREFDIIKGWHEALDKYVPPENDDYDNAAILSDSKWFDILQSGLTMKQKLAETLTGKESNILTEDVDYLKVV